MRTTPAGSAWLSVAAVLAFLLFAVFGVDVSVAPPSGLDIDVRNALVGGLGSGPLAAPIDVLNVVGGLTFGAIFTIGLAGVLAGTRRLAAAAAILSTWLAEGVGAVAKELLMRPRPPGAVVDSLLGESWSYPSGHVIRFMAVVAVIAWLAMPHRDWPRRALIALAIGALAGIVMGIARVAAGVHWPTDVIGGLLLGAAYVLVFAGIAASTRFLRRRSPAGERPPPPTPGPGSAGP